MRYFGPSPWWRLTCLSSGYTEGPTWGGLTGGPRKCHSEPVGLWSSHAEAGEGQGQKDTGDVPHCGRPCATRLRTLWDSSLGTFCPVLDSLGSGCGLLETGVSGSEGKTHSLVFVPRPRLALEMCREAGVAHERGRCCGRRDVSSSQGP